MTTFEEEIRKEFKDHLDRVKAIYEKTGNKKTGELIKEAEEAILSNDSLEVYATLIELEDEI